MSMALSNLATSGDGSSEKERESNAREPELTGGGRLAEDEGFESPGSFQTQGIQHIGREVNGTHSKPFQLTGLDWL